MIETGSVLYRIQYFFGNTSYMVLFIISLLSIYFLVEKKYRKILIIAILCFLMLYNDIVFTLLGKFQPSGTYYRFFWMIPVSGILAVLAAYILTKADNRIKKFFCFIIIALVILTSGEERRIPDFRIHKMENIYNLPEEAMDIIDMLDNDRRNASVVVMCPMEMLFYLRIYNGAYISAIPRSVYGNYEVYDGLSEDELLRKGYMLLDVLNGIEHDSKEISDILFEKNVCYIICSKDSNEQYYETIGCVMLGETIQYRIYKVER